MLSLIYVINKIVVTKVKERVRTGEVETGTPLLESSVRVENILYTDSIRKDQDQATESWVREQGEIQVRTLKDHLVIDSE